MEIVYNFRSRKGDYDEAERLLSECVSVKEKWFGIHHPKVADVLNDLADIKADTRSPW